MTHRPNTATRKKRKEIKELIGDQQLSNRSRTKIDIYQALKQYEDGVTYQELAKAYGCSAQNVHQRLSPYIKRRKEVQQFKENRADLLADIQEKILSSIDDKLIKKAQLLQRVDAAGKLYDKERLERGQSTENIVSIHADVAAIKLHRGQGMLKKDSALLVHGDDMEDEE